MECGTFWNVPHYEGAVRIFHNHIISRYNILPEHYPTRFALDNRNLLTSKSHWPLQETRCLYILSNICACLLTTPSSGSKAILAGRVESFTESWPERERVKWSVPLLGPPAWHSCQTHHDCILPISPNLPAHVTQHAPTSLAPSGEVFKESHLPDSSICFDFNTRDADEHRNNQSFFKHEFFYHTYLHTTKKEGVLKTKVDYFFSVILFAAVTL